MPSRSGVALVATLGTRTNNPSKGKRTAPHVAQSNRSAPVSLTIPSVDRALRPMPAPQILGRKYFVKIKLEFRSNLDLVNLNLRAEKQNDDSGRLDKFALPFE